MSEVVKRVRAFLDQRKKMNGNSTNILTCNDVTLKEDDLEEVLSDLEGLRDAYTGAMEDKRMWKARFLNLEKQLKERGHE